VEAPVELELELPAGPLHGLAFGPDDGPPAVGIPGLSANVHGFEALGERLAAAGRRLVALDLRGRGRSAITPPGTYGLEAHARDVLAAAAALGAPAVDLLGWSMGALVAMLAAGRAPDAVRRVVALDHVGVAAAAALDAVRRGLDRLDAVVPAPADYVEAIRRVGAAVPWQGQWERFYAYELEPAAGGGFTARTSKAACLEDLEASQDLDVAAMWEALRCPVLLVRANATLGGGLVVPPAERDRFLAAVPSARVAESEGNHYGVMTDRAAAEAVVAFLDEG
jgi:3-oxoadipate enol-lactonase